MAKKSYPNQKIVSADFSETTLLPNGDLRFDQRIGIQEYYPDDYCYEMLRYKGTRDPCFLAGQPRPTPSNYYNSMLIPNYQSLTFCRAFFFVCRA